MPLRFFAAALLGATLAAAQTPRAQLSAADAEKLESRLDTVPNDLDARASLLNYYSRAGAISADQIRPLRRKHILWLIEHHPESPVISSAAGALDATGHALADPEGYRLAVLAWQKIFAGDPPVKAAYINAAAFFKIADPALARKYADQGLQQYPGTAELASLKGTLDALAILGGKLLDVTGSISAYDDEIANSDAAKAARRELEATHDAQVLGGAGQTFSRQWLSLRMHQREARVPELFALAERCYRRAMELEPNNPMWATGLRLIFQSAAGNERKPEDKLALLEKALSVPGGEIDRWYLLSQIAETQLALGAHGKAAETATELLVLAPKYPDNWNYGNAIHRGNILLGRIALQKGDVEEAGRRLVAAGKTPGSAQLNSFGPDWKLAEELLRKGETKPLAEYIELVGKFWKNDYGRLGDWAATLAAGGAPNFGASPGANVSKLAGKAAPPFRLKDLAGKTVSLEDYKGKVVLLDFWATWCPPCRAEMPDFEKLHREFAGKDVAILAIDVDEPEAAVSDYIRKEKFTFPVLLSEGTSVVNQYGVHAYPTLVAVAPDGRVALSVVGRRPEQDLRDIVAKARAGAPSPADPPLTAPKLLSPAPGTVFTHFPRETTLVWAAVPDAVEYRVEVDYYSEGVWAADKRKEPIAVRVKDPVYSFQFYGAQPGRWRVWAIDAAGRDGSKSDWREFKFTR